MESTLRIASDTRKFVSSLLDGYMSDIVIKCRDGCSISAHRILLAACSDVFKAKFSANFKDAHQEEWCPEVGSSKAWQWLLGWVYGRDDPLPVEMLVEMLVLADMLQITPLVKHITELDIAAVAEEVRHQFLSVWACPPVLAEFFKTRFPSVDLDETDWALLQDATFPVASLFISRVQGISESDRLSLLGKLCSSHGQFPTCFVEAVEWHQFPATLLEAGLSGDFGWCGEVTSRCLHAAVDTQPLIKEVLLKAIVLRCQNLEREQPLKRMVPTTVCTGLFADIAQKGAKIQVLLSSSHSCNAHASANALFDTSKTHFGTDDSLAASSTWIEVATEDTSIQPHAVGLGHGWTSDKDICKNFVIEAACLDSDAEWAQILRCSNEILSDGGRIFPIPTSADIDVAYYSRFRIRMTGPNSCGNPYLMIGWFELFGKSRSNSLHSLLTKALS